MEVNIELGSYIVETKKAKVDLTKYNVEISVELFNKKAYLYDHKIPLSGGLPVGVEGRALAIVDEKAGITAALAVMRRGVSIVPIASSEKDVSEIQKYMCGRKIGLIHYDNIKDITKIAEDYNATALVVPDKILNIKDYDTELLILRPLIGK